MNCSKSELSLKFEILKTILSLNSLTLLNIDLKRGFLSDSVINSLMKDRLSSDSFNSY
jgi:hypothetical protein